MMKEGKEYILLLQLPAPAAVRWVRLCLAPGGQVKTPGAVLIGCQSAA